MTGVLIYFNHNMGKNTPLSWEQQREIYPFPGLPLKDMKKVFTLCVGRTSHNHHILCEGVLVDNIENCSSHDIDMVQLILKSTPNNIIVHIVYVLDVLQYTKEKKKQKGEKNEDMTFMEDDIQKFLKLLVNKKQYVISFVFNNIRSLEGEQVSNIMIGIKTCKMPT